jgi:hypothetical protein
MARPLSLLIAATLALVQCLARAGSLDDAPFTVNVPGPDWRTQDSAPQPMGQGITLAATVTNAKALLSSIILSIPITDHSDAALAQVCQGITDSFANPAVKVLGQQDTTFLGYKAKIYSYTITQDTKVAYNEAVVFISEKSGWAIACTGPMDQKEEIQKIFAFYKKKPN